MGNSATKNLGTTPKISQNLPIINISSAQVETGWLLDDEQLRKGVETYVLPYLTDPTKMQFFPPAVVSSIRAINPAQPHMIHGINNLQFVSPLLLLPIHITNHWILLKVELDAPTLRSEVYDSLGGSPSNEGRLAVGQVLSGIVTLLQNTSFSADHQKWRQPQVLPSRYVALSFRQQNGVDCGFFVFEWIRYLMLDVPVSTNQDGIITTRNLIFQASNPISVLPNMNEIYLSFCGGDGGVFASSLHRQLLHRGVEVFWNARFSENENVVMKQLENCKIFVCIISPAYISISSNLLELVKISQRFASSNGELIILPFFLGVTPESLEASLNNNENLQNLGSGISKNQLLNALKILKNSNGIVVASQNPQNINEYVNIIMKNIEIISRSSHFRLGNQIYIFHQLILNPDFSRKLATTRQFFGEECACTSNYFEND